MVTHPAAEELALLAEGRAREDLAHELESHLAVCRFCHAAWAEVVRTRMEFRARPEGFHLDEETLQAALRVGLPGRRFGRPPSLLPRRPWLLIAPAVGVVVVAMMLAQRVPNDRRPQPVVPDPIRNSIAGASAAGMILPGGEDYAGDAVPSHRGAFGTGDSALVLLTDMAQANLLASGSVDALVWLLSGYVAEGQLDIAQTLTRDARSRFPKEERLRTIAAVICYRRNDHERAESLFRDLLRDNPKNHVVALNLGLLLAERGQTSEAQELLHQVADEAGDTSLGRRARTELDRFRVTQ